MRCPPIPRNPPALRPTWRRLPQWRGQRSSPAIRPLSAQRFSVISFQTLPRGRCRPAASAANGTSAQPLPGARLSRYAKRRTPVGRATLVDRDVTGRLCVVAEIGTGSSGRVEECMDASEGLGTTLHAEAEEDVLEVF